MLDVLVVGAGPVGLFFANECARRRMRFRIVEARAAQSVQSKALAIFPRTLEIFDMAGIASPFLRAANRVTTVSIFSHQHKLAAIPFTPDTSPYRFVGMVPQNVTEQLLAEQLVTRGIPVEYNTTFVSASEMGDYVQARLQHGKAFEDVQVRYIVGCDGAHSSVRRALNLAFAGGSYPESFMLADIATNDSLPADELQLCPNEYGPLAIFPMSATRRRIVATVDEPQDDEPSLELVRSVLLQRAPAGIEATSLHWSSYFHIHHRQTPEMGKSRIFLAGDAAHIHSPFGGQGMNAGLGDAWNLVWKLDFAAKGYAASGLLVTYTEERQPIVKSVIEATDFITKAMSARNLAARSVRDTVIPIVSRLPQFQHAFVSRLSGLGISYEGSPIVAGRGRRYFDDSLRNGNIASRFILFAGSDGANAEIAAVQSLVAKSATVLETRPRLGPGLTLVRPDGYVAFESRRFDRQSVDFAESVLSQCVSIQ